MSDKRPGLRRAVVSGRWLPQEPADEAPVVRYRAIRDGEQLERSLAETESLELNGRIVLDYNRKAFEYTAPVSSAERDDDIRKFLCLGWRYECPETR